jgi:pilus assembly protein CpaB
VRTRLVSITLAAVLALAGAAAILAYVRGANERAINGLKAETVVVAVGAIPAGTSLSQAQQQGLLGTERVPHSSLTTAAVQSVSPSNGHLVVSGVVPKGQVLLPNMLASSSALAAGQSSPIQIPPGTVAVTVQLCASEAVANYLTVGSVVDVFATAPTSPNVTLQRQCGVSHAAVAPGGALTEPELNNIKVLAVTQAQASSTSPSTGSSTSSAVADPVSTQLSTGVVAVTLAVTPQQAITLIQVTQVYLPYLALEPTGAN